ncbi:MAG: helix-turn-helix domain-containing protein [Flavobacteriaceae bacterium]|jgi:excisionase family DNA binding protein|nr:helix-turn-helix domain-containing protein [Flavobacteriaceae bacterium]
MSLIRFKKVCVECKDEFIAKTCATVYCSKNCYKRSYRRRKRIETPKISTEKPIIKKEDLYHKTYLSINEVSLLYGISTTTIRRAIKRGQIKTIRLGIKHIILKTHLEEMLN